jgi:hypothetical protein
MLRRIVVAMVTHGIASSRARKVVVTVMSLESDRCRQLVRP